MVIVPLFTDKIYYRKEIKKKMVTGTEKKNLRPYELISIKISQLRFRKNCNMLKLLI